MVDRGEKNVEHTLIKGYPAYMRESIELVAATRAERLSKGAPKPMSAEARQEILSAFHPDYKVEGKRALRVGPSRGELVPLEIADLLEAKPLVSPDRVPLDQIDYDVDVLILGAGGAGSVAAVFAQEEGIPPERILIATKLRHGDCNSIMAQGGIQAADRAEDSPVHHYLDVIGGGHYANKPELVKALVNDGPMIIQWHEDMGVLYDKEADGYVEVHGGGTSRKRMHSAKDYTGKEIFTAIRDEVRNRGIPILEFYPAIELLLDQKGNAAGALLYNIETGDYKVVRAKATVLATGGFGRMHIQGFPTTNHYGATADGIVIAYRAGANIIDMDSVQYHPTGVAFPSAILGQLATEKLRGMGAMPVNKDGEAFVYHLEPRDVEAAAIIRECWGRDLGVEAPSGIRGVWLDTPMIEEIHGEGAIQNNLAAMWTMWDRHGIDIRKDPALVYPTLHYMNGGIEIEADGSTRLPGLFVGGEVDGGVHGKNRLMGNSLLDYNVFGRRAGISAAAWSQKANPGKLSLKHVEEYQTQLESEGIVQDLHSPMLLPDYRSAEVRERSLGILL
jgi:succinate dehydrogenase / fumarate reductase flavoprotein subunit